MYRMVSLLLLLALLAIIVNTMASADTVQYRLHGLNFSPYQEGQDPYIDPVVEYRQIYERMNKIQPFTEWVRTFSSGFGLENSGAIAHRLGLKAALGAQISGDLAANEAEISGLIAAARAGEADMLIVGSEVLLRRELSEEKLLEYLNRVKKAVPDIPVTYADVYGELIAHPKIIAACRDVVFANFYPYWEGETVKTAMANFHEKYQKIQSKAHGKRVIVSEAGWPSAGKPYGDAIPSPENAGYYFLNFISWARANDIDYFYFEAFDEDWKARHGNTPQAVEAHWGIFDKYGGLKPAMDRVFQDETQADNWSNSIQWANTH